jgi:hypothetical protein
MGMNRGPAVLATVVALALLNIGLASLIVLAVDDGGFLPAWAATLLLGLGIVAAAAAVMLWRGYLKTLSSH